MSHYVHSIPGRLRVRSKALRNQPEVTETARSLLRQLEGVISVDANLATGSLLIRYDDRVNATQILGALLARGWIEYLPSLPSLKPISRAAARTVGGGWRRVLKSLSDAAPDVLADLIVDKLAQRAAVALVRAVI